MQIPRFFVDPESIDLQSQVVTISEPRLTSQIVNVLRMRAGDRMNILDGRGSIYQCSFNGQSRNRARCTASIESQQKAAGEPSLRLTVALPLLKSGRFEWAIEKLTELGVAEIVPLETQRSVVHLGESASAKGTGSGSEKIEQKLKRWTAIAREAAEQCERSLIPDMVKPLRFDLCLHQYKSKGCNLLICAERSGATPLADILINSGAYSSQASLAVLIGPEGGFTENEFAEAENAGARPVTLGKRILRSETAALYATSLIVGCLDK